MTYLALTSESVADSCIKGPSLALSKSHVAGPQMPLGDKMSRSNSTRRLGELSIPSFVRDSWISFQPTDQPDSFQGQGTFSHWGSRLDQRPVYRGLSLPQEPRARALGRFEIEGTDFALSDGLCDQPTCCLPYTAEPSKLCHSPGNQWFHRCNTEAETENGVHYPF